MDRLYLVVREDLTPGQQISQCAHAKDEFLDLYPAIHKKWHHTSNTIVVMVCSWEELRALRDKSDEVGYASAAFLEPDMQMEMTALCLEPAASHLLKNFRIR